MAQGQIICAYIARHGTTILNQQGCFRGNKDVALSPEGIVDAHHLAHLFSNIDIAGIFCSDRIRATKTAEIIGKESKLPVTMTKHLRALDIGEFSGEKRTPSSEAELQTYLDKPDCNIPGGESLNDFRSRVRPCIREAIDLFMDCGYPPLIVGHSSIVHETGAMLSGDHKSLLVHPGGAVAIYMDKDGKLGAEPIYKPIIPPPGKGSETIS